MGTTPQDLAALQAEAAQAAALAADLGTEATNVQVLNNQVLALIAWVLAEHPGAVVTRLVRDPYIGIKLPTFVQVLTSIVVSPSSATTSGAAATQAFTAVAYDQEAIPQPMSPQPTFVWSTSNTGVATINSSTGVATAINNGTCTVTATVGSVHGNATLTTTNAVATHEPAGMTTVMGGEAMTGIPSQILNGTWNPGTTNGLGALVTFTNLSPTSVNGNGEFAGNVSRDPSGSGMRLTYPPNLTAGFSPVRVSFGNFRLSGNGTLYVRYQILLSSNWTANGNPTIKHFEPRTFAGPPAENHVIAGRIDTNGTNDPTQMFEALILQGPAGQSKNVPPGFPTTYQSAEPNAQIGGNLRGVSHQVEMVFVQDSPGGAANGSWQLWVDGNPAFGPQLGLNYISASDTAGWPSLLCDPVYGGTVASPPNVTPNIYVTIDRLYASVK